MTAAIETHKLTKRFDNNTVAVDNLDLVVNEGEVFGFLGQNGAGKSTTINLLLDFIRPTTGSATVLGMDTQTHPAAIRDRIGVLPEGYAFDDRFVGREYIEWAIDTKNADDTATALLDRVGLADAADRIASSYSKGMQQRLAFAMALAGDPDLLILDEPSTGLDPTGMQQMRDIIRDCANNGTTVFFSSHLLQQVEAVCDRVGIMRAGELIATDTIDALRTTRGGHTTIELTCATPPPTDTITALDGVATTTVDDQTLTATCTDPTAKVDVVTHVAEQTTVLDIISETVSLEELFAELTDDTTDTTTTSSATSHTSHEDHP